MDHKVVLYCTVLYKVVLYCTVLYKVVLCCTVLYKVVLCCTVLYKVVMYCTVQGSTVLYCTVHTVQYVLWMHMYVLWMHMYVLWMHMYCTLLCSSPSVTHVREKHISSEYEMKRYTSLLYSTCNTHASATHRLEDATEATTCHACFLCFTHIYVGTTALLTIFNVYTGMQKQL